MRLLPGRHAQAAGAGGDEPARVAEADRADGRRARRADDGRPRRPASTAGWPTSPRCVDGDPRALPGTRVETLISDAKGDADSLDLLFAVRPDVLNHNVETVARLQRAVRPSAGYARSLSVLARAKAAGLTTKSGLIVGHGRDRRRGRRLLADLAGVGVDIVTIGQYLRPTSHHLPVARWVEPAEFDGWKRVGESLGIGHVEASPLTRSSYHARQAADACHRVGDGRVALCRFV